MEKDCFKRRVIKITFVGYFSGKTCFINKYLYDEFYEEVLQTIGDDRREKNFRLSNGEIIKLILWGSLRFKSIPLKCVIHSDGVIIMNDITNITSFEDVLCRIKDIRNYKEDFPVNNNWK